MRYIYHKYCKTLLTHNNINKNLLPINEANPCNMTGKLNNVLINPITSTALPPLEVYPPSTGNAMNRNKSTCNANTNKNPRNNIVTNVYPMRKNRLAYVDGDNRLTSTLTLFFFVRFCCCNMI